MSQKSKQIDCPQLAELYAQLQVKKSEFFSAFSEMEKSKVLGLRHPIFSTNLKKAQLLKSEIKNIFAKIDDVLNPLEKMLYLKQQYEQQKKLLIDLQILHPSTNGDKLVISLDEKQEFPFPEYEEILELAKAKKDILLSKIDDGFTKLQITPLACEMYDGSYQGNHQKGLLSAFIATIRRRFNQQQLYLSTRSNPNIYSALLNKSELNYQEPIKAYAQMTDQPHYYSPGESDGRHVGQDSYIKQKKGWNIIMVKDEQTLEKMTKQSNFEQEVPLLGHLTNKLYCHEHEQYINREDLLYYALQKIYKGYCLDDPHSNGKQYVALGSFSKDSYDNPQFPKLFFNRDPLQFTLAYANQDNNLTEFEVRTCIPIN